MTSAAFGATVLSAQNNPEKPLPRRHRRETVFRQIIPTTIAAASLISGGRRQCITILLDPGGFLNRLLVDLILVLPRVTALRSIEAKVQRRWNCA
jgi:hypothetical protein